MGQFLKTDFLADSLITVSPKQIVVIFKPKDNTVTSRPDRTKLIMFYSSPRYICIKVDHLSSRWHNRFLGDGIHLFHSLRAVSLFFRFYEGSARARQR